MNKEITVWLIEDQEKVIELFRCALEIMAGKLIVTTTYRESMDRAKNNPGEAGIAFVDNTLHDSDDVGPAIARTIIEHDPHIFVASSTFDEKPVKGTHGVFTKNLTDIPKIIEFITAHYPNL